jgi:DNA-nicking Smr family endonuclease
MNARNSSTAGNRPSLDLHGVALDRVEARLEQFLHTARVSRQRQVEVITGRGASNQTGQPVLRKKVESWLTRNKDRIGFVQKQVTNQGGALLIDLAPPS